MKRTILFYGRGTLGNLSSARGRSCPAGQYRVLRGASWNNNERVNLRSSYRNNDEPMKRNDNNGFRCVVAVAGGKAPSGANNRRDVVPGQKPLTTRAKREPKPGGFTTDKTDTCTGTWPQANYGAGNPCGRNAPCLPGKRRGARPWPDHASGHGCFFSVAFSQAPAMRPISSSLRAEKRSCWELIHSF